MSNCRRGEREVGEFFIMHGVCQQAYAGSMLMLLYKSTEQLSVTFIFDQLGTNSVISLGQCWYNLKALMENLLRKV